MHCMTTIDGLDALDAFLQSAADASVLTADNARCAVDNDGTFAPFSVDLARQLIRSQLADLGYGCE